MNDDSIFPFKVMAVGNKGYVCKPSGQRLDTYISPKVLTKIMESA